jgi:hypothetical protein
MGFWVYFESTLIEFVDKAGVVCGRKRGQNDSKDFNLSNEKAENAMRKIGKEARLGREAVISLFW